MTRREFLTPENSGVGFTCRTLKTPTDKEWLGVFNSALLNLTEAWRWEQVNITDLTPEECAAICVSILDDFWASSTCDTCRQPNGEPYFTIDEFGAFRQQIGEEYTTPEGDYAVPPVPLRTGGTDADKKCLASANAAYVLQLMYEELTDAFTAGRSIAETITDFVLIIAALIAAPISLIVAAVIAIAEIAFKVLYETLEFITSDYWTSEFNIKLVCALQECAVVDGGGVVTFGWDCFSQRLAAKTEITQDYLELLLFGQIQYMLMFIGGDGLNLAGATTAITSFNCDQCAIEWCYELNLRDGNGAGDGLNVLGGTYASGDGWRGVYETSQVQRDVYGYWTFPATCDVVRLDMVYSKGVSTGVNNVNRLFALNPVTGYSTVNVGQNVENNYGIDVTKVLGLSANLAGLGFDINTGETITTCTIHAFRVYGTGFNPFGVSNCEP